MSIRDRIGIDIGVKLPIEEGIDWAKENNVNFIDFRLDQSPQSFIEMTPARCETIKQKLTDTGVTLSLIHI